METWGEMHDPEQVYAQAAMEQPEVMEMVKKRNLKVLSFLFKCHRCTHEKCEEKAWQTITCSGCGVKTRMINGKLHGKICEWHKNRAKRFICGWCEMDV